MQTIAAFKEGDWVDDTYLVSSKQVSTAKNGVVYLSLKLVDKTGEIDGKLWDNAEDVARRFEREDFVRIKGVVANYQGSLQVKMKTLEKVDDALVDLANFLPTSPRDTAEMLRELQDFAASVKNKQLSDLINSFLNDRAFMEAFQRAPAARSLHHNYVGGLMEHIIELIKLCREVSALFPGIDIDLVTVGAFLHDIGKVRELGVRKSIEYTTEGRLLGHISMGYEMLVEKIKTIPGFSAETAMLLKHIMLSHHGEYEFGSPKRPKIQEAIIINYMDDLSAKISNFQATLRKENVGEGEWTGFSRMHDRYLYRQASHAEAEPDSQPASALEAEKKAKKSSPGGSGTGNLPLDI